MHDLIELRCGSTMHAIVREGRYLEVKCKRRQCGASKYVIVLHLWDLTTMELVDTKRYRNPRPERDKHNASSSRTAVRPP